MNPELKYILKNNAFYTSVHFLEKYFIRGCTFMDNEEIKPFLDSINIPEESMVFIDEN